MTSNTPRTEAERLADWMMNHLVEYNRWMTTGWRDTMRDEAVVLAGQMLEAAAGPRDEGLREWLDSPLRDYLDERDRAYLAALAKASER